MLRGMTFEQGFLFVLRYRAVILERQRATVPPIPTQPNPSPQQYTGSSPPPPPSHPLANYITHLSPWPHAVATEQLGLFPEHGYGEP